MKIYKSHQEILALLILKVGLEEYYSQQTKSEKDKPLSPEIRMFGSSDNLNKTADFYSQYVVKKEDKALSSCPLEAQSRMDKAYKQKEVAQDVDNQLHADNQQDAGRLSSEMNDKSLKEEGSLKSNTSIPADKFIKYWSLDDKCIIRMNIDDGFPQLLLADGLDCYKCNGFPKFECRAYLPKYKHNGGGR